MSTLSTLSTFDCKGGHTPRMNAFTAFTPLAHISALKPFEW
jgi:hypothetical protein